MRRVLFYLLLGTCLVLTAAVSQRHGFQIDLSAQRMHSLSAAAGAALDALPAPLEITAFVPELPVQRAGIERVFAPYLAHSDSAVLRFVDPVAEPAKAREFGIRRHGEVHLVVGHRRERVAGADPAALDRALNRLALQGERWIVSFKGQGESEPDHGPGGLGRLADRLEDLGYRFVALDPRQLTEIPENTSVLLIAGPQQPYDAEVQAQILRFVERGGALLWLLEGPLPAAAERAFGVGLLPGVVVDAAAARYGLDSPDHAIVSDYPAGLLPYPPAAPCALKEARALRFAGEGDWREAGRLLSGPRSWNETAHLRGRIARNADAGEQAGPLPVGLALERFDGDRRQRAVFVGGSRFVGNGEVGEGGNMALAIGLVNWLSVNPLAADPVTAADLEVRWSPLLAGPLALGLMGLLPAAYLLSGLWWRGRRGRA